MWSKLRCLIAGIYAVGIVYSIIEDDDFVCFILILELILINMVLNNE